MLTENERKRILAGEWPQIKLARKEDCPEGDVVLEQFGRTPIVTLTWTGPIKAHGDYFASYRVVDLRAERLLRSTPPASRFSKQRSIPTADALERAAEESAYTRNPVQAMAQEPEAVPKAYQERISREAGAGNAIRRELERVRAEKVAVERRLSAARLEGRTATARKLKRDLRRLERDLDFSVRTDTGKSASGLEPSVSQPPRDASRGPTRP